MNGHLIVHEMSSSHLAHLPRIAGAFSAQATRRQSAVAADKKNSVRSRRVELRPIPRGRCCTTRKGARLLLLLRSVQLFN